MKLGLLGDHIHLHRWLPVLTSQYRHQIRWATGFSHQFTALPDQIQELTEPTRLLEVSGMDAVLVCGGRPAHLQVAKQLAGQDIPLILLPAASQGSAFLYELSLIRDDRQVALAPLFPLRRHPLVNRLRELLDENLIGELLEITIHRQHPYEAGNPKVKIADGNQQLLWDVDLFWQLSGKYNQVTALRNGEQDAAVSSQTVTLSASQLPDAIWSLVPGEEDKWELTLRGRDGLITLAGGAEHSLKELRFSDQIETVDSTEVDEAFLEELDSIEANSRDPRLQNDWPEYVHAMELVEVTEQSIRRRRTIDLYFDLTSERSQFKTQMAAIGCGVLMLTLFLLITVLMLGQLLSPQAMFWARILAFTPLFLFLTLQILIVLARPTVSETSSETN